VEVTRVIYKRKEPRGVVSESAYGAMAEAERAGYERVEVDDYTYYYTRYGSPLAYARAIDLICMELAGVGVEPGSSVDLRGTPLRGKRILDYGYGSIGQLRLLAGIGCDVTGVDVDPTLAAIYSAAEDQGEIEGTGLSENKPPAGKLKLVCGSWPSEAAAAEAVGGGFDVIISKNTLKNGYINPEREVDPRMLVKLGVERKGFVEKLAGALNPGGIVMIYNICPRPKGPDEPYVPWADGRCPFPREELAAAGLEVVVFDEDDTAGMRPFAQKLGWDMGSGGMDLQNDFVVTYTLLRKP
jgi:SAM-dependent methyltransferase